MEKKTVENSETTEQYRGSTLYMIFICGIILIIAGVIMVLVDQTALGTAEGTRTVPKGTKMIVTGPVAIGLGVLMSIFPVYQLIKNNRRK